MNESSIPPTQDRAVRKKLLLIACTCDRLEGEVAWKRRFGGGASERGTGGLGEWSGVALKWLTPFLPRWARMGSIVLRSFFLRR